MAETTVSGVAAKRTVITDECREMHGDLGAFHKAAFALLKAYEEGTQQRGSEKGVNYHLVLTVDGTRGCGNCGNDLTVAPEDEDPNPCDGCEDASNWKPRGESGTSQCPLLVDPIRPPLPERQEGPFNTAHAKDTSDRARRPTERLTRPKTPAIAPPEGSDATVVTTLTPEVEGQLHDAAQKDVPDNGSGGAECGL